MNFAYPRFPGALAAGPALALAALLAAGACASAPQHSPAAPQDIQAVNGLQPQAAVEPPLADGLHARLPEHQRVYREGIELIVAGEDALGEQKIATATLRIDTDARRCAQTPDCATEPFFDALYTLLWEQNVALRQQASRLGQLEQELQQEEDIEREPGTSAFSAELPEIERSVSLLRGTDFRELILLNGPVKAALDDWLTWLRPMLMSAYENYQYLRADIAPIYEEAGLPEALLFAMIATETGGKVHAYSRAGAAGLLQFMRRTGLHYGLGIEDGFDTRLDPRAATRASVAYLNDRFGELNDSLEKALAAYNGGENRIRGLHHRLDGASFWDTRLYWSLPTETREYVPRVLAAAWLFLHPEDYNLEFPQVSAGTAPLVVRQDIALGELTICLGQQGNPDGWFRTLRNLNPRLSPGERVAAGETIVIPAALVAAYEERCLDGELVARARELHEANYPDGGELTRYRVRRGDTLGKIARRFRCASVNEIAQINGIRPPRYAIRTGQLLKIPLCN